VAPNNQPVTNLLISELPLVLLGLTNLTNLANQFAELYQSSPVALNKGGGMGAAWTITPPWKCLGNRFLVGWLVRLVIRPSEPSGKRMGTAARPRRKKAQVAKVVGQSNVFVSSIKIVVHLVVVPTATAVQVSANSRAPACR
jgi:hypothetical protein